MTMTYLKCHRAHSNVGHQEQKVRQAETDQELVKHRKHYLEKQSGIKKIVVEILENMYTACFVSVFSFSHLSAQDNKTEDISHHADTRHNHSGYPGDPKTHVLK
mgnify:CR=1 FL=1